MENKNSLQSVESLSDEIKSLNKQMERLTKANASLHRENEILNKRVDKLAYESSLYYVVTSSTSWRITKPMRWFFTKVKTAISLSKKALKFLKKEGLRKTIIKIRTRQTAPAGAVIDDNTYISMHNPSGDELARQKRRKFKKDVKFSILVPLYNTPENFLSEMIDSVKAQSYQKWELCLADGSDDSHDDVGDICKKYADKDRRIIYKKLEENRGISGNTNACLDMATGNYIVLFDHDDLLHPSALYKNMVMIEEEGADFLYCDEMTFEDTVDNCVLIHFKPDFSPEALRGHNYICHLTVYSRKLFEKVGYFSSEHDGSQDHDMVLRLTEQAEKIVHIPEVLYYWRRHAASVASDISAKSYCLDAGKKAVSDQLTRLGIKGEVTDAAVPGAYRVAYEIKGNPLVSIIIANKDHTDDLDVCLKSIFDKTTYTNYEIIVVENNSTEEETFEYYDKIQKEHNNIKVITWDKKGFNYSAINNFGVAHAKGEYIMLLNNDIEVISCDWIESMLMYAQHSRVGAVGAKLLYPDNTIQHGGVILGLGGVAGHIFTGWRSYDPGYSHRLSVAQELSCVTAACLLTRREVWKNVGGLNEDFEVAFNDVDFCVRIREAGYKVIFTPFAELYHHESKSRGGEDTPEKLERFNGEIKRFMDLWGDMLEDGDPYYNPNLTLDRHDCTISPVSRKIIY